MIPPNTAPGTKVVCIDDTVVLGDIAAPYRAERLLYPPDLPCKCGFAIGDVFTVAQIRQDDWADCGFLVILEEIFEAEYPRRLFRPLVLPSALTDIITSQPVDEREKV